MPCHESRNDPPRATSSGDDPAAGRPRVLESEAILAGHAEVAIRHKGRTYRLRATRLGKLILTA
jgi:hemin uptake protein HemP